ncbi:hypothetical protein GCM10010357_32050 [Streptomyces luteireticuli]|uniref:Uncharacterized protein n=1 Tax=Streptomyces luteireticuli TaxID=173858 RepID=A0ABN0YSL5_9ACTN
MRVLAGTSGAFLSVVRWCGATLLFLGPRPQGVLAAGAAAALCITLRVFPPRTLRLSDHCSLRRKDDGGPSASYRGRADGPPPGGAAGSPAGDPVRHRTAIGRWPAGGSAGGHPPRPAAPAAMSLAKVLTLV